MGQREQREETVFEGALQLPAEQRAAYLDQMCAGDAGLRDRLECLLGAFERAGGFLKESVVPLPAPAGGDPLPPTEKPGDRIGRYKLLQQIGEGGCGVVYMAEQEEPVRRRVALKVIKLGMDTKQVIARFEAERQALALMDHPNIAKVLDAGATETGRPYFVMELVKGARITEFCDERNLSAHERLDLFIQVCRAVQHAHQKGIIHRDLKPSNILVTSDDGVPVPKVIDFGIAKATQGRLTDQTVFTAFEQFIGTPAYMSPEQAEMSLHDVDTRTDIYSLGVLLYELLTGRTPFDGRELMAAGLDAMRYTIREVKPVKPSTRLAQDLAAGEGGASRPGEGAEGVRGARSRRLLHHVRGDLDWIVMKCLEKDRQRRYETASGLAADLGRHLKDEPVVARPPSRLYEFGRTVRRHKVGFAATVAIILALAIGVLFSTQEAIRATNAEREQGRLLRQARESGQLAKHHEKLATESAEEARRQATLASQQELVALRRFYAAQMNLAMQAWDAGDLGRTLDLLETQRPRPGQQDLRAFEWFHLWGLCNARLRFTLRGHAGSVTSLAFSPDGRLLASSSADGSVRLWDSATGDEKLVLSLERPIVIHSVVFSPDAKTLASRSTDGLVRLWELPSGRLRSTLSGPSGYVPSLAISPDGKLLVSGGDKSIRLWDMATGGERLNLLLGERPALAVSFSPDGKTLAGSCDWGSADGVWLWDLRLNPPPVKARIPGGGPTLVWNPDGSTLTTVPKTIEVRDPETGKRRANLKGHTSSISSVAYLPDGKTLASCGQDRTVRLWKLGEVNDQNAPSEIVGAHLNAGSCLAASPDGSLIASGDIDGIIKVWGLGGSRERAQARFSTRFRCGTNATDANPRSMLTLADKQLLVVAGDGTEERGIEDGKRGRRWPEASGRGALSANGRLLATSTLDGTVKLWSMGTGQLMASFSAHATDYVPPAIALSPDARILVTGGFSDGTIRAWDVTSGARSIRSIQTDRAGVGAIVFSPDGRRVAAALRHQRVWIFDPSSGRTERILRLGSGSVETLATVFSPGGKLLATGGDGGIARLWEVETGRLHVALKGHTTTVRTMAFSPDGDTLATGSDDRTVRLWDVATGQERVTFKRFEDSVAAVAFSPDGATLLASEAGGMVWMLRSVHTAEADSAAAATKEETEDLEDLNLQAWAYATDPDPRWRDGRKAVELSEKAVAGSNRRDPMRLDTLAAAYAEVGQFTNAVRVQTEAIALLQAESQIRDYSSRLRLYRSNVPYREHGRLAENAAALLAEGKPAEAEALARECLTYREAAFPDDWRTFNARSLLGGCLLGLKKFTEAEPLLISGYEGMKQRGDQISSAGKGRPREALQRLVQFYEETKRPDRAAEWRRKVTETEKAP